MVKVIFGDCVSIRNDFLPRENRIYTQAVDHKIEFKLGTPYKTWEEDGENKIKAHNHAC